MLLLLCLKYIRWLLVPSLKAIRNSMSSNGIEVQQIVHTYQTSQTSHRSGWPRGFGAQAH